MASTRIMNNLQDTLLTLSQEYHLHCDPEDHDPVQEHGRYRMVRQFLLFDTCRFPIRLGSCIQGLLPARLFSGCYWHIRDWKFGLRFGAKQYCVDCRTGHPGHGGSRSHWRVLHHCSFHCAPKESPHNHWLAGVYIQCSEYCRAFAGRRLFAACYMALVLLH